MTLCVGFRCRDGVVIGADRQMSGGNYTFPDVKLSSLKWVNGRAIWGYAGQADTAKRLTRHLETHFGQFADVGDALKVHAMLRESLKSSLKHKERFYTLFGASIPTENYPLLLLSDGRDTSDVDRCDAIGQDSPLVRYLRNICIESGFTTTTSQAVVAIIYIISQVKKFDGKLVGDEIDISIVRSDPRALQRIVTNSDAWVKELGMVEERTAGMFGILSNSKMSEQVVTGNIESYISVLKEFAAKVRMLDFGGKQ